MNIFHKVTVQGMKKSKTRTLVTILGVILSAAMITAIATFVVSLQGYLIKGAEEKYGNWQVAFSNVGTAYVSAMQNHTQVKDTATFQNIGYASLEGAKNPNKPYVFVAGFSQKTFDMLPLTLVCGRLPQNEHEVLVPSHLESNGGVKYSIGETLSLQIGNRIKEDEILSQDNAYQSGEETLQQTINQTYRVVGIYQRPSFEEYLAPGYTLITRISKPVESLDETRMSLFVTLKNPRQIHTFMDKVSGKHAYFYNDNVLRFMGLSDDHLVNSILYSVGAILLLLVMIGSVFLIYNSFHISLNERMHQFGILSSVGATPRQLKNSVLFEGVCIGVIGIPIGILTGIGSMKLVLLVVAKNITSVAYGTVPLELKISYLSLIVATLVSMVTILISAYIPAKKAANMPIMESIRQTNEIKVESKSVKTGNWMYRLFGLEAFLALKNFKRNKRQYKSIVLSLTFSIVLFVSVSAFKMYLNNMTKESVVDMDEDILFTTKDISDQEMLSLYKKLDTVDGVKKGTYQSVYSYSCNANTNDFSKEFQKQNQKESKNDTSGITKNLPVDIQFIPDQIYYKFVQSQGLHKKDYTGSKAKVLAIAKKRIVKSDGSQESAIDIFDKKSMTIQVAPNLDASDTKSMQVTFVDTYPIDPPPTQMAQSSKMVFMVVAPYSLKANWISSQENELVGMGFTSKNPSNSVAQMQKILQNETFIKENTLYNVNEILEQNRNILFVVNVFTYVFVFMISLIATANVFNTISTNIRLRRRELAMLRSIGMSDSDFKKMMNFECVFYGLKSFVFGTIIAFICVIFIYLGINTGSSGAIAFQFPWLRLVESLIGVFVIVFITMLYAIRKIKKENIMDALLDDMN